MLMASVVSILENSLDKHSCSETVAKFMRFIPRLAVADCKSNKCYCPHAKAVDEYLTPLGALSPLIHFDSLSIAAKAKEQKSGALESFVSWLLVRIADCTVLRLLSRVYNTPSGIGHLLL